MNHGKKPPPPEVSRRFLLSYLNSLQEIKQHPQANLKTGKHVVHLSGKRFANNKKKQKSQLSKWESPQSGWMKLNIDGSFDESSSKGGIGAILRNSTGQVIFAACGVIDNCSGALQAELLACKEGINMAIQWTFLPLIVETDCLVAKQLIQANEKGYSELAFLVQEIQNLCKGSREVVIKKADRSQNRVSHALANRARCESLTDFWPDETCNFISHLVCEDSLAE